jgi:hypothetical protein
MPVFWDKIPQRLVHMYQLFGDVCCLHLQRRQRRLNCTQLNAAAGSSSESSVSKSQPYFRLVNF